MTAPTRPALLSGVSVLMREAERLNIRARQARAHLNAPGNSERMAGYLRGQIADDVAESCLLGAAAGWMQAQINAMGATNEAASESGVVTSEGADA